MRLKTIKLAGFKSFVDPTQAHFPTNLSAVVGPNGCGKSNIIDAVRWVMGESSAKHLRGESMTDVIFNGSSGRKPVGQASIELVFDNADRSLGGEYAQYAEIAIKRVVTREARSDYYLNGTRCRRKDITDIFLGTGLGPRSYAIIEQGMISRLIESKPEELRVYIEEAAGVSKYKERRRETENRMRHTRENLERLQDIREELGKQLSHLERQARDAEKYKILKSEERHLREQVLALRWRQLNEQVAVHEQDARQLETELEAAIAQVREHETNTVKHREAQFALSDEFNQVQSRYYQVGNDIARLEQAQRFHQSRLSELQQSKANIATELAQNAALREQDEYRLTELAASLDDISPNESLLEAELEAALEQLAQAESALAEWQLRWDEFQQSSQAPRQRVEVEQSRIQLQEHALRRGQERIQRLSQEQDSLHGGPLEEELALLTEDIAQARLAGEADEEKLQHFVDGLSHSRQQLGEIAAQLDERRRKLQALKGRESALLTLQAAAEKSHQVANEWLQSQGVDGRLLYESLQVDHHWDAAVEVVLGPFLHCLEVNDFASLQSALGQRPDTALIVANTASIGETKTGTLSEKVKSAPAWLTHRLADILLAADLTEALALRSSLTLEQSVITPEGLWLGHDWLFAPAQEEASQGLLARRHELDSLLIEHSELEADIAALLARQQQCRDGLRDAEVQREQLQREVSQHQRKVADLQAQQSARQVRLEQVLMRRDRLSAELSDAQQQLTMDQEQLAEARLNLQTSLDLMTEDTHQRENLLQQRDNLREQLEQCRGLHRLKQQAAHEQALQLQKLSSQQEALRSGLSRLHEQAESLMQRQEQLAEQELTLQQAPDDQRDDMEALLAQHHELEAELGRVRDAVEHVQTQLREAEQGRVQADQRAQIVRDSLTRVRLEWQGTVSRRDAQAEQLLELETTAEAVLEGLADGTITEHEASEQLEKTAQRIARLGAINLAAIEEFAAAAERKVYLDQQDADLQEALTTLENAIRKIDRETRNLFKETFDKVNAGLQELFPKVFGGGNAYLQLTDDDLLEAGVSIMARPPGKKNSTIHLLSGGEKALTALSLVFSIFQLNPAPFCMLDEVDAPLDDANVGRFARLVEEMSHQVQFVYITHNKIAMEMAQQLMGVTMQEPGVSRLVSVNVDEAAALASQ